MLASLLLTFAPQGTLDLHVVPPEQLFAAEEERALLELARGNGNLPFLLGELRDRWDGMVEGVELPSTTLLPEGTAPLLVASLEAIRVEIGRTHDGLVVEVRVGPHSFELPPSAPLVVAPKPGDLGPLGAGLPVALVLRVDPLARSMRTMGGPAARDLTGAMVMGFVQGNPEPVGLLGTKDGGWWLQAPGLSASDRSELEARVAEAVAPSAAFGAATEGTHALATLDPEGLLFLAEEAHRALVSAARASGTPWPEPTAGDHAWMRVERQGEALALSARLPGTWVRYWPLLEAARGLTGSIEERQVLAQAAKVKADLVSIDRACIQFQIRNGRHPEDLEALVKPDAKGRRYLASESVPVDPWGRVYVYEPAKNASSDPQLYTLGADGKKGGEGADADISMDDIRNNRR